jgi:hypothetical protein
MLTPVSMSTHEHPSYLHARIQRSGMNLATWLVFLLQKRPVNHVLVLVAFAVSVGDVVFLQQRCPAMISNND